ncbi:class I SAM-dependent methyltransferase [soil metagenome]
MFEELKQKQSVMWGNGPYARITALLTESQENLVAALQPQSGERWLDVATGTGAVARLVAQTGADVTGLDLSPALIETARDETEAAGLSVVYDVGDAEALPYDEASFDGVVSTFGVMFAPDHGAVARELARVCRPDGRLGLASWCEAGGIGELFRVMRPFQASPPPPGVGNPFAWGDEAHVRDLLEDACELDLEVFDTVHRPASAEEAWETYATSYGPTKTLAESLDDERRDELEHAWIALYETYRDESGAIAHHRPYLRVLAVRR